MKYLKSCKITTQTKLLMSRVLVTGGAGFIGTHTCLSLIEKGYDLCVVDSFVNSSQKSLDNVLKILKKDNKNIFKNLEIFKGDIRDKIFLNKVFKSSIIKKKPIKNVIHFAGLKSVEESIINPSLYWDCNFVGSLNLIKAMLENNCYTIVFSSSATIYGLSNKNPINENGIICPINPYGRTKNSIEVLLGDIFNSNKDKLRVANLRYFNPIGAHPSGLIGEDPRGKPNNIFPLITKVAVGKIDKINVYGSDWGTKDGTGIRDYIHVMDIAEGHIKSLDFLCNNEPQLIKLNLGTGIGTSVLELINTFQKVNKIVIPYKMGERREGDVGEIVADNSKAKNLINWEPKKNLEDMCRDGYNWQFKNPNGF